MLQEIASRRDMEWGENLTINADAKIYLMISKPNNLITLAAIRQVQPAYVYVAYPPETALQIPHAELSLDPSIRQRLKWCPWNPMGPTQEVEASAHDCLGLIRKDLSSSTQLDEVCVSAGDDEEACNRSNKDDASRSKDRSRSSYLSGVLFNSYGSVGNGLPRPETGLLALSEYKLIGNAVLLRLLLENADAYLLNARRQPGQLATRIIFVGSESARGLPKMGFPVPQLGTTGGSVRTFLTGAAYQGEIFQWEKAYANLCAITVLYVQRLARRYPQYYFGVVSPGMTDESFRPEHTTEITFGFRLQLLAFSTILFPMLEKAEIAKTAADGASLLVAALTKANTPVKFAETPWKFKSGTFAGAKSGTGGPVCDQTELEGGAMFMDQELQDVVYKEVQGYVRS